jgi:hypothetical protein
MTILNNTEVTIDTVTPTLSVGEIQVSADRRGKDLKDSDRIRRAVLPAGVWGNITGHQNGAVNQGLTDVLVAGLKAIANARLRDYLQEQPLARTVALADYSVTALLTWNAETASSRGSLTFDRDDVTAWYAVSALRTMMLAKGTAYDAFMSQRLAALAAKNHGLKSPDDASKLITLLADDASSEVPEHAAMTSELIQRLAHIEKALNIRKLETTISMSDL